MKVKRLDVSKATALGWSAEVNLRDGLKSSYGWALENIFDQ